MSTLNTKANFADADAFYAELLSVHEGCNSKTSGAINARLILLLANHIGDPNVLSQALQAAKTLKR